MQPSTSGLLELFQFRGFNTVTARASESRNLIKSFNAFQEPENVCCSRNKTFDCETILNANVTFFHIKSTLLSTKKHRDEILTSESLVKLREVGENGQSIGHHAGRHVFGVQECRNSKMLLGRSKSQLVVSVYIVLVQAVEVAVTKKQPKFFIFR